MQKDHIFYLFYLQRWKSMPHFDELKNFGHTAEKSVPLHQERVALYHHIHDLHEKKADIAELARQGGVARRTVYQG